MRTRFMTRSPTGRFAAAVREDERTAAALGVSAVPCFVIDRRFGAPGAQPPENPARACSALGVPLS